MVEVHGHFVAKKTPTSIRVNKTLFASLLFLSCLILQNLSLLYHRHVGAEQMMIATIRRKVQEGQSCNKLRGGRPAIDGGGVRRAVAAK